MKRSRLIVSACLIVLLAGLAYYFYGGGTVPSSQRPLVVLKADNFATLQQEFNGAQGTTRLFVLMSPT